MYSDCFKDFEQIVELDENITHLQLRTDSSSIYPWEMSEITMAEVYEYYNREIMVIYNYNYSD